MSLAQQAMEAIARRLPDAPADPLIHGRVAVGQPLSRVDGPLKVAGAARFTADVALDGLAYASLVCSAIARGRITRIDDAAARATPGVIGLVTHETVMPLKPPPLYNDTSKGGAASRLPVMQDDSVRWNGQAVAVVVAESQEIADEAAALVRVEYESEPAALSFDALRSTATPPRDILGEPPEVRRGDAERALADAAVRVDATYRTPRHNHAAMELHATTAVWEGDDAVTVYDASQILREARFTLATTFGLKEEQVRMIAPFVGGAFGGKTVWSHTILCVAAAKMFARPVRLVLSREDMFRVVGGRAASEQRVALGARADGTLTALVHTGDTAVVRHNAFPEQFSFPARHLYASETLHVAQRTVALDIVANTAMRAPGESIGTFALESAMDELATASGIDPIALRARNEPTTDPTNDRPFSSRHLVEAYRRGAVRFGWHGRTPRPRAQRDGDWWVGQGVATAYYPYYRLPGGSARVRLTIDGRAVVQTAAHEMGMGTATAQAQHAADRLGLPVDRVTFEYGDTRLPIATQAGGSSQTASIAATIIAATAALVKELIALAGTESPLAGASPDDVVARDGGLYRIESASQGESYAAILARAGRESVEAESKAPPPLEMMQYSMHSYGAQFCEVRVHDVTGEVRVARWLGSFDVGRIVNPKTAASQFRGGIVMGIGMALTEEGVLDARTGRAVNASLAEYHVPVHRDIPEIDVLWNDIPDPHAPLGVHGIGEIGITGCAAAIANAIYHATGRRIRELPITLDRVLAAPVAVR